MTLLNRF